MVLSHRESKDIFILGGTDDIQVLLDDSQVCMSRHCICTHDLTASSMYMYMFVYIHVCKECSVE